jgi:AraC-like DNA-binding protein
LNKANFHIDPDLSGVELLSAKFTSIKSHEHIHEEYAIGIMEEGVQGYNAKRKEDYMEAGDIPLVNPFTPHKSESLDDTGFRYRMLYIKPEIVEEIAVGVSNGKVVRPKFPRFTVRDAYLEKHMMDLHKILMNNLYDPIQKQHYFHELIAYLVKNHAEDNHFRTSTEKNHQRVARVMDFIHAYYTRKIELKELADVSQLSPFHLNRMFAREVGLPPHRYLINLRLNKSRELLKSQRSITDVALQVGFYDQSHYIRNFKLYLGITPKQYQMQIR